MIRSEAGRAGYLQETALIVNAQPGEREALRRYFAGADYHVLAANSSEDALAVCRDYEGAIHLLVTDIESGAASGWKLAESAARIRPGLVVLFLSAEALAQNANGSIPRKPPAMLFEVAQTLSHRRRG